MDIENMMRIRWTNLTSQKEVVDLIETLKGKESQVISRIGGMYEEIRRAVKVMEESRFMERVDLVFNPNVMRNEFDDLSIVVSRVLQERRRDKERAEAFDFEIYTGISEERLPLAFIDIRL